MLFGIDTTTLIFILIVALIILVCYLSKTRYGGFDSFIEGGRKPKTRRTGEPKMFVQEPWLTEIIEGRKTVEGRAAPKDTFNKWIGQKVKVYDADKSGEVTVSDVVHYDNLDDYLKVEWKKAAPHTSTAKAAKAAYEEIYYSDKKGEKVQAFSKERVEARGGIEAIHISKN